MPAAPVSGWELDRRERQLELVYTNRWNELIAEKRAEYDPWRRQIEADPTESGIPAKQTRKPQAACWHRVETNRVPGADWQQPIHVTHIRA